MKTILIILSLLIWVFLGFGLIIAGVDPAIRRYVMVGYYFSVVIISLVVDFKNFKPEEVKQ